jgi:hypothetical protein
MLRGVLQLLSSALSLYKHVIITKALSGEFFFTESLDVLYKLCNKVFYGDDTNPSVCL